MRISPKEPMVFSAFSLITDVSFKIRRSLEIQLSISTIFSFPPTALPIHTPNNVLIRNDIPAIKAWNSHNSGEIKKKENSIGSVIPVKKLVKPAAKSILLLFHGFWATQFCT